MREIATASSTQNEELRLELYIGSLFSDPLDARRGAVILMLSTSPTHSGP